MCHLASYRPLVGLPHAKIVLGEGVWLDCCECWINDPGHWSLDHWTSELLVIPLGQCTLLRRVSPVAYMVEAVDKTTHGRYHSTLTAHVLGMKPCFSHQSTYPPPFRKLEMTKPLPNYHGDAPTMPAFYCIMAGQQSARQEQIPASRMPLVFINRGGTNCWTLSAQDDVCNFVISLTQKSKKHKFLCHVYSES